MSSLRILLLMCDGVDDGEVCDADFGGDPEVPSIAVLREQADAEGWQSSHGRDLCPDHREGAGS